MASKLESLLKYKNPHLVSSVHEIKLGGPSAIKADAPIKRKGEKAARTKAERDQDYLNTILPPMQFMDGGQLWVKYVSP